MVSLLPMMVPVLLQIHTLAAPQDSGCLQNRGFPPPADIILLERAQLPTKGGLLTHRACLNVDAVTLEHALLALHSRSGVDLAFSPSLLPPKHLVNCSCDSITVAEALTRLLGGTSLRYAEVANQVIIEPALPTGPNPLLLSSKSSESGSTGGASGGASISRPAPTLDRAARAWGVVVDHAGRALAGTEIKVVGTGVTTVSDGTGRFSLTFPIAAGYQVEARRMGYRTLRDSIEADATDIRLVMSVLPINLDEVVVTGTAAGAQARAIANPIGQINVREVLQVVPLSSVHELVGASVSGVSVASPPGNVGTGSAIRIRGASSISLGSTPLVYVDGVRIDNDQNAGLSVGGGTMRGGAVSRLNDLNLEEIENVQVIKGPAAATLFGTEASAGVIQITTKKGRSGAPAWEVTVKQGATWLSNPVSRWPAVYDLSTTPCTNCRLLPGGIREFAVLESEIQRGIGTPWVTGHDQSYAVGVRGGTNILGYYFSGQLDRDVGYVDWNWQNKVSARANLDLTPSQQLSVNTNMGFVRSTTRFDAPGPFPAEIGSSIYWGTPRTADTRSRGWNWTPPEAMATVEAKETLNRFIGSVTVRHSPSSWLTHRLTGGADLGSSNPSRLFPRSPTGSADYFGALNLGQMEAINREVAHANLDYGLTATVNLPGDLVGETSVGAQFYLKQTHEQGAIGNQFPVPGKGTVSSASVKTGFEDFVENKTLGLYVQEQFGWKNRRFVTAALRGDDNSAFGENFNFVVYPKFSATWVVHEEPFWTVAPVSALKLRAAWGRAGRQPDVFAARRLYAPFTATGDQPGLTPDAVGNPDLKPEVGEEFELGFDAGVLNDRISAHFTYYNRKTKDAILQRPVAPSSGFSGTQFVNLGLLNNRGVEIEVDGRLVESPKVEWDLGFTLSTNHSKVVSLGGLPPIVLFGQRHEEGYPIGAVFMYKVLSAEFDAAGKIVNDRCEATPAQGGGTVPCSQAQPVYWGPAVPTWEGGANMSLRLFRNLSLFARVDYEGGYWKISGDLAASHLLFRNSKEVLERKDPVLATMGEIVGDWLQGGMIKGGFAKLRDVSLTYTVPQSLAAKLGASQASISLAAHNLATLWWAQRETFGRKEIDPELSRQWTSAQDLNAYHQTASPPANTLTLTLRLTL
jgi:TonB-dependent SusC/RagA subfamily outer membrane receptor